MFAKMPEEVREERGDTPVKRERGEMREERGYARNREAREKRGERCLWR